MDLYFLNSLFAGDLLEFLFRLQHIPWEKPHTQMLDDRKSQFHAAIGNAVNTIWKQNEPDIYVCYMELKAIGVKDKKKFAKYALGAADMYFSEGYSPGSFLGYCAIVMGVSTIYYECPSNGIPEIAAEVVALVLMAHQLTGQFDKHGGWNGLLNTSKLFNEVCTEN